MAAVIYFILFKGKKYEIQPEQLRRITWRGNKFPISGVKNPHTEAFELYIPNSQMEKFRKFFDWKKRPKYKKFDYLHICSHNIMGKFHAKIFKGGMHKYRWSGDARWTITICYEKLNYSEFYFRECVL